MGSSCERLGSWNPALDIRAGVGVFGQFRCFAYLALATHEHDNKDCASFRPLSVDYLENAGQGVFPVAIRPGAPVRALSRRPVWRLSNGGR